MDGAKRNPALPRLPERSEVDQRYTWNLASIYPSLDAWREDFKRVEEDLPTLEGFSGHLGDSAQKLLQWFNSYGATLERMGLSGIARHAVAATLTLSMSAVLLGPDTPVVWAA